MNVPWRHPRWATVAALILLLWLGSVAFPARADDSVTASLEYTVEADAYNNTVLAAYIGEMLYPRIVIYRSPSNPFDGTMYLVGIQSGSCPRPVTVRSFDRGETWEPPRVADLCVSGLTLDAVIDDVGTLWAAAWGPKILRSTDGGLSWSITADFGTASAPASIAYDRSTHALYVAWAPLDVVDGGASTTLNGPLLVASSTDGGQTWTTADLLGDAADGSFPEIAAHNNSVVVAGIARVGTSDPFVATIASQDRGRTWSAFLEVSPPNPCAPWAAPSIAASPSGVFAVSWYENRAATGPSSCWDDGGASTEAWVSVSRDGGRSFSSRTRAGGPPVWPSADYLGGRTVFDDESRLYVTWHSISADGAAVYVSHYDLLGDFQEAFFTTQLRMSAGNTTGHPNMAVDPDGAVYLVWRAETFPFEAPASGIFVRGVSGQASGSIAPVGPLAPNDGIEIELRDPATSRPRATVVWSGSTVVVGELPPIAYDLWLRFGDASLSVGSLPIVTWGRTSFTIRIEEPAPGNEENPWKSWATVGVAAAILLLSAAFAALQYTRIEREDVFQRKIRLLMFEYVQAHPGSSFSEVRDTMGLKNGVASYHLGVLEHQGLLHSESRRRRRWYFANGDVSLWKQLPISGLQKSILDEVGRMPGIGVRELSRTVNRRASSVSDNVKALNREGLIRTEQLGRKLRCFPKDDGTAS